MSWLERYRRIILLTFFAVFVVMGVGVHRHYGLSYDEPAIRDYGVGTLNIVLGDDSYYHTRDKYHGTAFEVALILLERIFRLTETRDIYWMRHLATFFLFLVSVFSFFRLCARQLGDWKWGLFAAGLLLASPRIFADAFYNTKDIPFVAAFIISFYTLLRFQERPTPGRALLHAIASAFAIDIRIMGVLIPCFTFLQFAFRFWLSEEKGNRLRLLTTSLLYVVFLIFFTILFWPILWKQPFKDLVMAFVQLSRYPWPGDLRYLGEYMKARDIPWHYAFVWIGITTPVLYLVFAIQGIFVSLRKAIRNFYDYFRDGDAIFLLWLSAPLMAVLLFNSTLYDGWRHLFYLYPALIFFSVLGFRSVFDFLKKRTGLRVAAGALVLLIVLAVLPPVWFMVRYHPYQNVYFNFLAGGMKNAKKNFEMDYWGLSYLKALQYILEHDSSPQIIIRAATAPGWHSTVLLPPQDRARLIFTKDVKEAKYLMSNYRGDNYREDVLESKFHNEFYSIKVEGVRIMVVYKLD